MQRIRELINQSHSIRRVPPLGLSGSRDGAATANKHRHATLKWYVVTTCGITVSPGLMLGKTLHRGGVKTPYPAISCGRMSSPGRQAAILIPNRSSEPACPGRVAEPVARRAALPGTPSQSSHPHVDTPPTDAEVAVFGIGELSRRN